jgi:hypothetical protein
MKQDEVLLRTAIRAIQSEEPSAAELVAASSRVAHRLSIDTASVDIMAIESCDDVRQLFPALRAGVLSAPRTLLVEAHLRDCSACRHHLRGSGASLDWSKPKVARVSLWPARTPAWAVASALALLVGGSFVYRAYWQVPPGVRAEVQSIDGSAYRIAADGDRLLAVGDSLADGEHVRTSGGGHAVLRLADGSTVEVNERSVLEVGARGHNTTVTLDDGGLIVEAAKRDTGHLYVKTPDCRVAVTGTVFSINTGIKGSRVAVLQGTVDVQHSGIDSLIQAGDQVATSDNLTPSPVAQQIAWSHDRDKYLPLLAQFATLERSIEQIPFPQSRFSSDILDKVPADTLLYISIPNLGQFLSEANQVFQDQLKQSPALQQWWNQAHAQNSGDFNELIEKVHQTSKYLGDEIVAVAVQQSNNPAVAILADVKQGGLDDYLRKQFPSSGASAGLHILGEGELAAAHVSAMDDERKSGGYALIRSDKAIFSNSIAALKIVDAQLNSGSSGFASSPFGKQVASAYTRGAGILLAADLQQMVAGKHVFAHEATHEKQAFEKSGIQDVSYLIAEHRETNGEPENRLHLQFSGPRHGVASWLAAPAPIGSLAFITPNAAIAVAALSKDPAAIADDIMSMTMSKHGDENQEWTEAENKLQINFRAELAATLGGDFLLALDGPVLPTPSWKAVIEVNDSQLLEQTLEKLADALRSQTKSNNAHSIVIESADVSGKRFYSLQDTSTGTTFAQYTFANGYMIVAPTRALIMEALQTYASGDSLGHSAAFRALLPKDADENYSAIAYQNLTPVLTPLLSQFSGDSADALRQLAADARPTAICARGDESSIEASSDSHLFGSEFLTLGNLIGRGNKNAAPRVRE